MKTIYRIAGSLQYIVNFELMFLEKLSFLKKYLSIAMEGESSDESCWFEKSEKNILF
jgi:hypothetical protein